MISNLVLGTRIWNTQYRMPKCRVSLFLISDIPPNPKSQIPNPENPSPIPIHFHLTPGGSSPYSKNMDTESQLTGTFPKLRGFTLIELLVVIGIISLLAAILIPTIHSSMRRGKRAACMSNLHQIAVAGSMMLEELEDRLPPRDDDCSSYNNFADAAIEHIPFLKCSIAVFNCPDNKGIGNNNSDTEILPADLPQECSTLSGPVNTEYEFSQYVNRCDPGGGGGRRQNGIEDPNRVAYVWDYPWSPGGPRAHEGGINCGFLDGHAESLFDGDVWSDEGGTEYKMLVGDEWWQERGHIWGRF